MVDCIGSKSTLKSKFSCLVILPLVSSKHAFITAAAFKIKIEQQSTKQWNNKRSRSPKQALCAN